MRSEVKGKKIVNSFGVGSESSDIEIFRGNSGLPVIEEQPERAQPNFVGPSQTGVHLAYFAPLPFE